jgi:glutamate-1-semialdehyde 2,1-aminomutase
LYLGGVALAIVLLLRLNSRLTLSAAKHRSLTGHARMSRMLAKWIPYYEYNELEFFNSDEAPASIAHRRRDGFFRLSAAFNERIAKSSALSAAAQNGVSDMQFVARNRVPFQYGAQVRKHLKTGSFWERSSGVTLTDLDGNSFYDLTGSYGVNVFGYDFYKECIDRGADRVRALGPVLGGYHPLLDHNVRRLRELSGMDEVSFHMSGTEAVMQAVRLARYHTKRTHVVRFCGAYHGWWGDVQPGVGNPIAARETYTLNDMSDAALRVLRTRKDIACVLINPLQALHPNANAPGDSTLLDSSRTANFNREAYAAWLLRLREICTERNIALIFDEVFVGFRLALGGAQEFFGVRADMVTYGKTLGGGLPVGVVCGHSRWMKRFNEDRPADICFARGTFNSHPYVLGAMYEFLERINDASILKLYASVDEVWNERARRLNERLKAENIPIHIANMSTIWTLNYTCASRYNWMLQYYLRAEGLALSWIGTGRLIFSLNYSEADFSAVADRIVAAGRTMLADGWWWSAPHLTNRWIKRRVLKEIVAHRFGFAHGAVPRPVTTSNAA